MGEYIPFLSGGAGAHRDRQNNYSSDERATDTDDLDEESDIPIAGFEAEQGDSRTANIFSAANEKGEREWFVRVSPNSSPLHIPKRLAHLARLADAAEAERLWNDQVDDVLQRINCHKTILYFLGKITKKDLYQHPSEDRVHKQDSTYKAQALHCRLSPLWKWTPSSI